MEPRDHPSEYILDAVGQLRGACSAHSNELLTKLFCGGSVVKENFSGQHFYGH